MTPTTPAPLTHVYGEVAVPYRWALGPQLTHFFNELRDSQRILAVTCTACGKRLVPPTPSCGRCYARTEGWTEVGPQGVIKTFTTVNLEFPGQPRQPPYTWVQVQLDGSSTLFPHLVDECDPEEIKIGMRVEAVWAEERTGDLYDITHFRPVE